MDTGDPRLRERFRRAAAEQTHRIDQALSAAGVDQLLLSTDADVLPALASFLDARRRRRGAPVRLIGLSVTVNRHVERHASEQKRHVGVIGTSQTVGHGDLATTGDENGANES